jgi:hypothetical protein
MNTTEACTIVTPVISSTNEKNKTRILHGTPDPRRAGLLLEFRPDRLRDGEIALEESSRLCKGRPRDEMTLRQMRHTAVAGWGTIGPTGGKLR